MQYVSKYNSPLGEILLAADDIGLIGLWFIGQKYFKINLNSEYEEREIEIIKIAKKWLDIYFSGKKPKFKIKLHLIGTDFQKEVWQILSNIPYGKTITYKDIAIIIASKRKTKNMAYQAVGKAVGKNPISIIIPCHRVVGTDGSLTGYAGGIDKKIALLKLEKGL